MDSSLLLEQIASGGGGDFVVFRNFIVIREIGALVRLFGISSYLTTNLADLSACLPAIAVCSPAAGSAS